LSRSEESEEFKVEEFKLSEKTVSENITIREKSDGSS
jgi:hypothetical protein